MNPQAWWNTPFCHRWELQGPAALMVMKRLIYVPAKPIPANDRDHIRW